MAFWGRRKWLEEGAKSEGNRPVSPWEEEKVEAAGYRLSVGSEYFVKGDGTSTVNQLNDAQAFVIGPGQFAFILTKEKVRISKCGATLLVNMRDIEPRKEDDGFDGAFLSP